MSDTTVDDAPITPFANLTDRELEVLALLSNHHTSKAIARRLDVAPGTVDKHVRKICAKLGVNDRNDAARAFAQLQGEGVRNHTPQKSTLDEPFAIRPDAVPDLPASAMFQLFDVAPGYRSELIIPPPAGLETLDRKFGIAWRIAAIPLLAILIGMILIWAVSFAKALSEIV